MLIKNSKEQNQWKNLRIFNLNEKLKRDLTQTLK